MSTFDTIDSKLKRSVDKTDLTCVFIANKIHETHQRLVSFILTSSTYCLILESYANESLGEDLSL